jgi:hypothetical protein
MHEMQDSRQRYDQPRLRHSLTVIPAYCTPPLPFAEAIDETQKPAQKRFVSAHAKAEPTNSDDFPIDG